MQFRNALNCAKYAMLMYLQESKLRMLVNLAEVTNTLSVQGLWMGSQCNLLSQTCYERGFLPRRRQEPMGR